MVVMTVVVVVSAVGYFVAFGSMVDVIAMAAVFF